ncbi:MAG: hypothetical protein MUD03_13030 [Pirellula sp.]|nr:hypothetical protein [Pirellula sp.]
MNFLSQIRRLSFRFFVIATWFLIVPIGSPTLLAQLFDIPQPLLPWKEWSRWDEKLESVPTLFDNPRASTPSWSSTLQMEILPDKGLWQLDVQVFADSWVHLPGDAQNWPQAVLSNGAPIAVLLHEDQPAARLSAGRYRLQGEFVWTAIPQKLTLPKSIGILSLVREGTAVPLPNWDASGTLWLNRQAIAETEQDLLTANVYRLIEDGIPLWLRTQVDLSVSGRSREESLGTLLPEGWILSSIESQLPVAIDEQGAMKIQVRPGNWTISIDAFQRTDIREIRFAAGTTPISSNELVGFKTNPPFRVAEIEDLQAIDVQKTTFPDAWRDWQVYQWETSKPFRLVEKMRGLGASKPKGIDIARYFWLDDDGMGITFQDQLLGDMQQSSRLDVTEEFQLGMVRLNGERQLITANPITGRSGIETRNRVSNVEALGRLDRSNLIPAAGWMVDVNSLRLTMSLPPGWRMFAVLGADSVDGDWLTAWSLLDLFVVLVFSLGVYRLFGIPAGLLALFAFGLAYHEPGAPRWTWLFLLLPVALLRVVNEGRGRRWIEAWRFLAMGIILLNLIPFISREIQLVLYPQLDSVGTPYSQRTMIPLILSGYQQTTGVADYLREDSNMNFDSRQSGIIPTESTVGKSARVQATNLAFDPSSRMQTGPARPEWTNNTVHCHWDGPVTSEQRITPIYISRTTHRILSILRCGLLLLLTALLFRNTKPIRWRLSPVSTSPATASVIPIVLFLFPSFCYGQFPDQNMLEQLRKRTSTSAAEFKSSATISRMELRIEQSLVQMNLEVHSANQVAIPLPGKLAVWSPASVRIERSQTTEANNATNSSTGGTASEVTVPAMGRREDGHLWVVVPPGVHRVEVEGYLAVANDWELAFILTPKQVAVLASQWQVVGLGPNGVPESQLFFTRIEKSGSEEAKYDQRLYRPIVMIERRLELGLIWKVRNKVTRLSSLGKAVALKIPLLNGERVLSSTADSDAKAMNVNLSADQAEFEWDSELEITNQLEIRATDSAGGESTGSASGDFVEKWVLVSSPTWHIVATGAPPIYEEEDRELIPTWRVWPGEKVVLEVSRPQAISGESVTITRVSQAISLGARQSNTTMHIDVVSSLGGDFAIQVAPEVDVLSITIDGLKQPVRRMGQDLILTLRPGEQKVELKWSMSEPLKTRMVVTPVQMPVPSANVTTFLEVPSNRWILWAEGPMRGPAVRMWIYWITSILVALILGGIPHSPLSRLEWVLLAIGLTQLHAIAGLIVVGWLLWLSWRGRVTPEKLGATQFNLLQVLLVLTTLIVFGIFLVVVAKGLLGSPEMFIVGNGSYGNNLNWFEPKVVSELPRPSIVTVSIWFYRLAMLLWALWLASALIRWLQFGWQSFSYAGRWCSK